MSDKMQGGVIAGAASVSLSFVLRSAADSTETTGKVASDMTLSYWRQGGSRVAISASDLAAITTAWAAGGVKPVDASNMPGVYRIDLPDAAFVAGADWVEFCVKVAGCFTYNERIPITSNVIQTGDSFARLGAPAGASHAADVAAVKTDTAAINAKTTNLPSDPADASDIAAAFATVMGAIPTANANADALLDRTAGVETGLTLRQFARLAGAALFGKVSGLPGSPKFRDKADTKDRIAATTDTDGNRSAVTLDAS